MMAEYMSPFATVTALSWQRLSVSERGLVDANIPST